MGQVKKGLPSKIDTEKWRSFFKSPKAAVEWQKSKSPSSGMAGNRANREYETDFLTQGVGLGDPAKP